MSVTAHHHEVGGAVGRVRQQRVGDIDIAAVTRLGRPLIPLAMVWLAATAFFNLFASPVFLLKPNNVARMMLFGTSSYSMSNGAVVQVSCKQANDFDGKNVRCKSVVVNDSSRSARDQIAVYSQYSPTNHGDEFITIYPYSVLQPPKDFNYYGESIPPLSLMLVSVSLVSNIG